ncbi:hypothetical protein KIN20_035569 [Parelaphostrongylus tenuis]|uniref:Major sperm protein n=1 Tax=Parelaphostrongylus tenuis TaxID=148309 RepID=A0AAD5RBX5_PARTN|nr:hypothetical protein KIN20_035569 [Parelaphostrongylus tenuis]
MVVTRNGSPKLALVGALGWIAYHGNGAARSDEDEFCTLLTGSCSVMRHPLPMKKHHNETPKLQRTQSNGDTTCSTAYKFGPAHVKPSKNYHRGTPKTQRTQNNGDLTSRAVYEFGPVDTEPMKNHENRTQKIQRTQSSCDLTSSTAYEFGPVDTEPMKNHENRTLRIQRTQSSCDLTSSTAYEFSPVDIERSLFTCVANDTETAIEMPDISTEMCISDTKTAIQNLSSTENDYREMSPLSIDSLLARFYGDLLSNPPRAIHFKRLGDVQTASFTNLSGRKLKYRIQIKSIYKIRAYPRFGVLRRGKTLRVRLALNGKTISPRDADCSKDKLTIEYEPTNDSSLCKHQEVFHATAKHYSLDLLYHF